MKCTTYEQLHLEMARVYKMCVGTEFEGKEYLCVKQISGIFSDLPRFTDFPASYEFALGIVEDSAVWAGDELWNGVAGCMKTIAWPITNPEDWSWNPPASPKPKTVSISVNGGEAITLWLPDGTPDEAHHCMWVGRKVYYFKPNDDMKVAEEIFAAILDGKYNDHIQR